MEPPTVLNTPVSDSETGTGSSLSFFFSFDYLLHGLAVNAAGRMERPKNIVGKERRTDGNHDAVAGAHL